MNTQQRAPRLAFGLFSLCGNWDLLLTGKCCFISVTWFYFMVFHLLKFLTWRVNFTPLCHIWLLSAIQKLHISAVGIQHVGLMLRQHWGHSLWVTKPFAPERCLKITDHWPAWTTLTAHRTAEHKFQLAGTSVKHWGTKSVIHHPLVFSWKRM